jgi:hypothetical protein
MIKILIVGRASSEAIDDGRNLSTLSSICSSNLHEDSNCQERWTEHVLSHVRGHSGANLSLLLPRTSTWTFESMNSLWNSLSLTASCLQKHLYIFAVPYASWSPLEFL